MISVAIVDDKRDLREGYKIMLNAAEGFHCNDTYESAESAIVGLHSVILYSFK